jgi:hypothetical protein
VIGTLTRTHKLPSHSNIVHPDPVLYNQFARAFTNSARRRGKGQKGTRMVGIYLVSIRWVGLIKKFHVQARSVDAFVGRHIDFKSFLQSFHIMIMSKSGGDESVHFCSRASHYPSLYCTKIVSCTGMPANSSLFRMTN